MNTITFTPAQLISLILAICAAIVTISAALGVITRSIEKAREPENEQNKRLDEHEHRLNAHDDVIEKFREYFDNDDRRFKEIERSNKITQSAILALLKHSINGEDMASLKAAEKSLEDYLIDK